MYRLLIPVLLLFTQITAGQNYAVSLIPEVLKRDADAVLRNEETVITVHSVKSATIRQKTVFTILNESGDDFASFFVYYDKFRSLNDLSAKLYDASGKLLKSVKKKEMNDHAYDDNMSLVADGRVKEYNFYCRSYPYTVEFEQEMDYNGIYDFPEWQPLGSYDCAVESSSYTVLYPTDYAVRYKLLNGAPEPVLALTEKSKQMKWQTSGIPAVKYQPFMPSISKWAMRVLVGPGEFEYGGYKGSFVSWDSYGRYYLELYKGRDVLPEEIKKKVHELTDTIASTQSKIESLYKYMQENTHYISIQLGIGSLQPFDAQFVAEKKYGDCKALSNFMVGLLKEAGIKAYPAVIYGGSQPPEVYDDFPKHYFNHVVTCVPAGKDTMWLECTSQTESAGYSGSFTGNRTALLVTEDGGKLVHTPVYSFHDNVQQRSTSAKIDEEGNLTAAVNTRYTGVEQELPHHLLYDASPEKREKYLNKTLGLPTYKVEQIRYTETRGRIPAMDESLVITSPGYASVTGKRVFISPNIFNKTDRLPEDTVRKVPVVFNKGYSHVDSAVVTLPAGFVAESVPRDVLIKNRFGTYSLKLSVKDNVIVMCRTREQLEGSFPASVYPELQTYYNDMAKADRMRIVMVKK